MGIERDDLYIMASDEEEAMEKLKEDEEILRTVYGFSLPEKEKMELVDLSKKPSPGAPA